MKPVHILLVEDNEGDILLITEALQERRIINRITVLKDGKQAIDYLSAAADLQTPDLPDLLLLDVNLPKKNGHEVLSFIKQSELLKHIPVIMLTTSSSASDINRSYKSHANCYITKPVEADDFMEAISKIENFWVHLVKLPGNS
jgi:CheY-like chemotaxis protein